MCGMTGEGADELFAGYEYLRTLPSGALDAELAILLGNLHNTNLQRADRLAMAASVEARVPFLDVDVVAAALALPARLKLRRGVANAAKELPRDKYLLRRIAATLLPAEIAWRGKEKFSWGTGTAAVLAELAQAEISRDDFQLWSRRHPELKPESREEVLYYRLFERHFPGSGPPKTMGRTRSIVPREIQTEAI